MTRRRYDDAPAYTARSYTRLDAHYIVVQKRPLIHDCSFYER